MKNIKNFESYDDRYDGIINGDKVVITSFEDKHIVGTVKSTFQIKINGPVIYFIKVDCKPGTIPLYRDDFKLLEPGDIDYDINIYNL